MATDLLKKKKRKQEVDDVEVDLDFEDDDEEEVVPRKKKDKSGKTEEAPKKKKLSKKSLMEDDDDEEEEYDEDDSDDDDDDEEDRPAKSKKSKGKKSKRRAADDEDEDDDDSDEDDDDEEEAPRKGKGKSKHDPKKIKQAVAKLLDIGSQLNEVLIEREEVIIDGLRALLAGENLIMLGPPGTAKSLYAKLFTMHFENANLFSWLLNKSSDPSEVLGPFSVKAMEQDKFLRITTGKLPEAQVGFLDETFKSNEPMLNALLTIMNEKVFYNDGKPVPVPLRLMLGASNEFPESEELDAFYDRFLFRHWVKYVQDPQARIEMAQSSRKIATYTPDVTISLEEIDMLREHTKTVKWTPQMEAQYDKMYRALNTAGITVSDRRYVKGQFVMMANAVLNDRTKVSSEDFVALKYIFWGKDIKEIETVEKELSKYVNPYEATLKELLVKAKEVRDNVMKVENRTEKAGEAVQADTTLKEIIGKMEDEVNEAKAAGYNIKQMKGFVAQVEDMVEEIHRECLKGSARQSNRKGW